MAWLGYAAVALWFVAPVLGAPSRLALGHPANDVGNHVWGYAWVGRALAAGELPTHTTLLAWPDGGSLWFIDAFGVLLTLPINLAFGPVAAYNCALFFNFWWAGVAAGALAERVSGSRAGGVVAGFSFMATPQLLGQAYNGISETLAVGWLPLALLAMEHAVDAPSVRRGALAGLALAVATLFNWYYGLFGLICALGYGGRAVARSRSGGPPLLGLPLPAAAAAVVFVAVVAAPFAAFSATMSADDALVTRDPDFVWRTLILHNMTDVEALLHPGKFYSPDLATVFGEDLIVVVYVGVALVLPAVAAAWLSRGGTSRFWFGVAVLFGALALGPFLYVGGDYVQVAGGWVPLPFLALFEWFPSFSRISHAYRFVVGLSLALSVLAALAVRGLGQRGVDVGLVAALLVGLRLWESTTLSSAVFPLPVTPVDPPAALARLDGGAVLDLPVGVPILARSRFLLGQLAHGQPVPFGLNEPTPELLVRNHYTQYLIELERSAVSVLPERRPFLDLELGRAALVDAGLRWVVVHQEDYPPGARRKVEMFLDQTATAVHEGDGLRIYRLDPAVSPLSW